MKKLIFCSIFLTVLCLNCDRNATCADPVAFNENPELKGCGDLIILKKLSSSQVLSVYLAQSETTFSTDFQVFEKIQDQPFAHLRIEQNDELDKIWQNSCNDEIQQTQNPSVFWTLVEAKLSYKVSEVFPKNQCNKFYRATVILEDAKFLNAQTGEILSFEKIDMENVVVGWCAG